MRKRLSFAAAVALVCIAALGAASPASAAVWPSGARRLSVPTSRVAGPDRYSTAVAIGLKTFPGWTGVAHIVIASGEDRAAADPLTAASLCWAYDAPLLLTRSSATPADTRAALAQIVSANTTVTVHVVGGAGSVPADRIAEIKRIVGAKGTVEQPWKVGDRYTLARDVAARVRIVAHQTSRITPSAVFIANGESRDKFWDALAASAIARQTGVPVLLTAARSVPAATIAALAAVPSAKRIVVGGPGTVTPAVYASTHANVRWSGIDRYATASAIASGAVGAGWADTGVFAVAVAMPDAVAGAGLVGRAGGVLLLSSRERVAKATWELLTCAAPPHTGYLLGGTSSATPALLAELNGAPAKPALGTSTPAVWSGAVARVVGSVGGNTTSVKLLVDGATVATRDVLSWGTFDFGSITVPATGAKVTVVALNPDGKSASCTRTVNLRRFVVCIDPGHQAHADSTPEPIGPGATQTKPSVSAGATGVYTRNPEYRLTLLLGMNLKKRLEAAGIKVVMTRTVNDVNVSNAERAAIANSAGADLFVRIHCDGNNNSAITGISTLYPAPNRWTAPIASDSHAAADTVQAALIRATGAVNRGAVPRSDLAGFNWSKVPTVLVETGFLSNPAEDRLLATTAYQDKLAQGMAQGVQSYLTARRP